MQISRRSFLVASYLLIEKFSITSERRGRNIWMDISWSHKIFLSSRNNKSFCCYCCNCRVRIYQYIFPTYPHVIKTTNREHEKTWKCWQLYVNIMVFHQFSCMIGNISSTDDGNLVVNVNMDPTPVEEKKFLSHLDRHLNRGDPNQVMTPNEKSGIF